MFHKTIYRKKKLLDARGRMYFEVQLTMENGQLTTE